MIIFGKWPLWLVIAVLTVVIAAALVAAGNIVIAVALVAVVAIGAAYWLRDQRDQ